ncbi:MAG: exosome non-catalytic core subunit rrp46 [Candelina mexicana]|nr:MAG: exosome non-catalytic core subunit rrp46 [Candelina mexicana]
MTVKDRPSATLSHLYHTDGSATFSQNGYTIIGAVNGPIEVQRKDELPDEAALEIIVRPASGVGGTRERHLEAILHSTLRHIILIQNHPRTLIQLTLQVASVPENDSITAKLAQSSSTLPILPALLQTSMLTILSASIALSLTLSSALVAVTRDNDIVVNASPNELQQSISIHVLAFSSKGDLLLVESEGDFDLEIWEAIYDTAFKHCRGSKAESPDDMVDAEDGAMETFLRRTMQQKIASDLSWKADLK